jgi:adenylate kinase
MIIMMLGAPGVGKGTISKMVQEKFSLPQISTGDMLRKEVADATELGKLAKGYLERGELVPDFVVTGMVRERVRRPDCRHGFILDGFPRTVEQADALGELFGEFGLKLDAVFSVEIPEEELVRRLSARRICRSCGAIYNLEYENMRPAREGVCNVDGGPLYQREDEKPEVIRDRLREYRAKTAPLIDYYAKQGLLKRVTGPTSTHIFNDILKLLGEAA